MSHEPTEPSPFTDPREGTLFAGRYQIHSLIGMGGMARVYRASHTVMDRWVALKILSLEANAVPERVQRFEREMKVTAKVIHPNAVLVYDYGQTEQGELFISMELLSGTTLSRVLEKCGSFAAERVVAIGAQLASVLSAAHAEQIIHRDLNPDNIMLLDHYEMSDFVKLMDFGLARFSGGSSITRRGVVVGSLGYVAPEQMGERPIDHRSDLYQLGLVLYTMAAGRHPFAGKDALESLQQQMMSEAKPLREVVPGKVPPALDALILRLLARAPEERPQSAAEVGAALQQLAAVAGKDAAFLAAPSRDPHHVNTVVESSPLDPTVMFSPGRRRAMLLAASVVLLVIGAAVFFLR